MLRRTLAALLVVACSLAALLVVNGMLASPAPVARANSVQSPDACITIDSDVTTNTTWSAECYHIVTNTVEIQSGVMLTITPPLTGTRVEFETKARLSVAGTLLALGDPARPITFTSAVTQTRCAWQGIVVANNPQSLRLQYSTIEYACTGVTSNDADELIIVSNTFRYLGDSGTFDGAIGSDTDNSTIANNTIYSSSNGIVLNESSGNSILHNTIYDIDGYGIALIRQTTTGGNRNTVGDNIIYRARTGLRLEDGSSNQVLTNSLTLNTDGGIYLDRQGLTTVAYNHVYTNGGGAAYRGSIFITGTGSFPTVQRNVVLDGFSDAVAVDASATMNTSQYNALCATASNSYELRNNSSTNVNVPNNWWGTNTPLSGVNYIGQATLSDPIVLSITLGATRLPADASATTIVTVTLRDSLNNTVPAPNRAGDPNARRIALQTTLGSINPAVVDVNDQGVATAVLTAVPQVGTGVITATAFCNYPIAAAFEITQTNVTIAKTSPLTQVVAGGLVTYTISYSNPSSVVAPNVVITDSLPAGLNYAGDTSGYPANVAANRITWSIGALPAGTVRSFVLTTTVSAINTVCGQVLTNTAAIGTSALESNYADNSSTAPPISIICPNVAITKTAAITQVYQVSSGSSITYAITYSNAGNAVAPGVVITDLLPAGMVYVGDNSGFTPAMNGNQIVWSVGVLAPGLARSFILTASVPALGANCRVFAPNAVSIGTPAAESTYADNTASTSSLNVICAEWAIAKTAVRPSGPPTQPIDFTIIYTNNSTVTLSGAIITDQLPVNTIYISDTSGLPVVSSGNLLTWTLPALTPGAAQSFLLRVQYTGASNNVIVTNTACISSALFDSNPTNNCSSATYLVQSQVDVVVVKDDDVGPISSSARTIGHKAAAFDLLAQQRRVTAPTVHRAYVNPGDIVTYTIAVVNVSNYTATNFILTETLPLYMNYVGSGWTFLGGRTYTQSVGTLYPGGGRIYYFVTQVYTSVPSSVRNLINYVCGFGSEADINPDDNCHYEDTPLRGPVTNTVFLPLILKNYRAVEPLRVSFTSLTYHVSEAAPAATISVKLDKPWTQPVTVDYHTEDGTATAGKDYTPTLGTLTFAPGQVITTFSVGIISDTLTEYWETVSLILSNPHNAQIGYPGVATLYIDDVRPCVVPSSTLVSLYSPMDVAYDAGTDRLFIANRDGPQGGSLYTAIISPTPQITHIVTDLLSAQGVAQDSARHRLYVIGWDWLNVLNSDTYSVVATITLGSGVNAHAVAYNPNNSKIYVTGYGDNSITIVDANTLSVITRLTNSTTHPLLEPSYIALEPNTNKVYVTNHAHGRPSGWVTVVEGFTNQIAKTIYPDPGGELYGAAVDPVHGHVYIAAINTANIYVIDAATDTQLGSFQVRRWSDNQPVPLRMIAVNPNPGVGTKVRLWLTSSSTEDNGLDNVISLTGNWPNLEPPALGADLPHSPERGIRFDPVNKYLFIASAASNRVTILRDTPETQQCLWPFVEPRGPTRATGLYVVVNQTTR
jgi:uncharacterized repeat protein (TIGR01451 family)